MLERSSGGGPYTVTVPALPAIVTQGDTREQALENARDAIRLYLDSLGARRIPVPSDPKVSLDEVRISA